MANKTRSIVFTVVGAVSFFLSIVCFTQEVSSGASHSYYGGDAYTGIQNAAADTSKNVVELSKIAKTGFGSILLVAGLAFIGFGLTTPVVKVTETKEEEIPVTTEEVAPEE